MAPFNNNNVKTQRINYRRNVGYFKENQKQQNYKNKKSCFRKNKKLNK